MITQDGTHEQADTGGTKNECAAQTGEFTPTPITGRNRYDTHEPHRANCGIYDRRYELSVPAHPFPAQVETARITNPGYENGRC